VSGNCYKNIDRVKRAGRLVAVLVFHYIFRKVNTRGKAIPLQPWTGRELYRKLRPADFMVDYT
jgi:hypothetical protein